MKRKKVVVAGHACIDITPKFIPGTRAEKLSDILLPGRLINMNGIEINCGGAVSNTGLAMKLLGCDVRLAAKTGRDDFGALLKKRYAAYGVTEGVLEVEGERTSYSVVIAVPGIDRIFLHDPGANDTFGLEDVKKIDFSDVALFHLGYPPIMRKLYQNGGEELEMIYRYVKAQGAATSLDLAAVDSKSEAGQADWQRILERVIPWVDFFVPSVEELCWMLDRETCAQWNERAAGDDPVKYLCPETDIKPLAERCLKMGAKVLLLKCGSPGLYYATADAAALDTLSETPGLDPADWSGRSGFECSYRPKQVLSATGAGDTTIAAFLTAMLSGYNFEMCIRLAAAEGASCVEGYGGISAVQPLEKLEQRIRDGWKKNPRPREI